ncbi:hypothetical protein [Salipiger abyssi]|uniref:hypothetical protein n=1 Tax=Salipiger abyssi TaxID=1250539 RepID=UPI001A8E466E|nr:hypothetical protein [Salipiger abyssi]MBN9890295.1 hypothetical protein [Salipiger abyssi]
MVAPGGRPVRCISGSAASAYAFAEPSVPPKKRTDRAELQPDTNAEFGISIIGGIRCCLGPACCREIANHSRRAIHACSFVVECERKSSNRGEFQEILHVSCANVPEAIEILHIFGEFMIEDESFLTKRVQMCLHTRIIVHASMTGAAHISARNDSNRSQGALS